MDPAPVSAAAARRFLVERHLLAPARSLPAGLDGVRAAFGRLGSIQFDPLSVAGRNHDLVLHARVRDYDSAWTNELLYGRRELFETYNKGLSLLPTSELPWYRLAWDSFLATHQDETFVRHRETVDHVLGRIRDEGPLSSLDFEKRSTVDWYWGPTSEVRAVLEALAEAGLISLARRAGNRRYLDLTERLYPADLLAIRVDPQEQRRHKLLSRYRAHGLLGESGQSELWYGTAPARHRADGTDDPTRGDLRDELVASGDLVPIAVEGVPGRRYVIGDELELLRESQAAADRGDRLPAPSVALLAPLDPLAWDRQLLRDLFDFDYVWEVYVPQRKRRWGYYVLPLLWGDHLVGRIEPRIEREAGAVRIMGLWWQEGFDPRRSEGFVEAMRTALAAYAGFGGVAHVEWGDDGAAKRLFGVRPRLA